MEERTHSCLEDSVSDCLHESHGPSGKSCRGGEGTRRECLVTATSEGLCGVAIKQGAREALDFEAESGS